MRTKQRRKSTLIPKLRNKKPGNSSSSLANKRSCTRSRRRATANTLFSLSKRHLLCRCMLAWHIHGQGEGKNVHVGLNKAQYRIAADRCRKPSYFGHPEQHHEKLYEP
ncbi:unnamed protein product [Ectocarpus sp. 12 AP-2014]